MDLGGVPTQMLVAPATKWSGRQSGGVCHDLMLSLDCLELAGAAKQAQAFWGVLGARCICVVKSLQYV